MSIFAKGLFAAAALLLLAVNSAAAASRHVKSAQGAKAAQAGEMKAAKQVRGSKQHEYENVAGFNARVNDPRYAFASEPAPVPKPSRPVVTSFPMPYTVWW